MQSTKEVDDAAHMSKWRKEIARSVCNFVILHSTFHLHSSIMTIHIALELGTTGDALKQRVLWK